MSKKLTFADLRNKGSYEFIDISTEEYRTYRNPVGDLFLHIVEPIALAVSESGHRVLDADGTSYWINATDFAVVEWRAKEGQPHFVK
jgi:hypothetical protein